MQKDVYERSLKSVREFPVPEPTAFKACLIPCPSQRAQGETRERHGLEHSGGNKKSGFIDKLYGRAG